MAVLFAVAKHRLAILLPESFAKKACSSRALHDVAPEFPLTIAADSAKWYKVMMQSGDKPRLLFDSVILGIIGGLGAQLFMWMLRLSQNIFLTWLAGYRPPGLPEEGGVLREMIGPHGLWLVPVATTIGRTDLRRSRLRSGAGDRGPRHRHRRKSGALDRIGH